MVLDAVSNFVRGSTDASVDSTQTTVSVADASIFPDPSTDGEYNVVIWDVNNHPRPDQDADVEILRVTAVDTNNDDLTVTRGQEATSGASHPSGSAVHLSPTAKMFGDIESTIGSFWDDANQELTADVNNQSVSTEETDIAQIGGKGVKTSTQSIPSGSVTTVELDSAAFEDSNIVSVDTTNNEIVVNKNAKFDIKAAMSWANTNLSDGTRVLCRVDINGSIAFTFDFVLGGSNKPEISISDVKDLSDGDVITFSVFQDTGSDKDLEADNGNRLSVIQEG